jgi:pimeloyl-ACP methyl ester carboxylesterase
VNCGACWPEQGWQRLNMAALSLAARAGMTLLLGLVGMGAQAVPDRLTACRLHGVEHEALCGTVSRALDPARESGVRIELHFAVLPALARNKKPDPVFFLAGGPGQSAMALAGPVSRMLARFGHRRDIVLVDQRGTGRSAPLDCGEEDTLLPLRELVDAQRQLERARACLQVLQALPHGDLRHYTTTLAMADLDAVRRLLGAERVNLVGASYGTRAALEYMRLYPQHVRRVVLDGVAPPDMALPDASAPDAQASFDALLKSCEQDPVCRTRHAQLRQTWQTLLASLPRTVSVPHALTGQSESLQLTRDMLLGMVRAALYTPTTASALPAALAEAQQGRFAPLVGLSSALAAARGSSTTLAQGMHFSVVCAEDLPGTAGTVQPAADFGQGLAPLYREVCAFWPRGAVSAAFRELPTAPAATLLLSGGIDPATPPRHGARVAHALGAKARHEVVPNAGHGLLALPCLRDAVFRFVDAADDADALHVDTGCARDIPRPPAFVPPGVGGAP